MTLGIETSCDETGASVTDGRRVLANVVTSSVHLHKKYGGVVPEIASRFHLEFILEVLDGALRGARKTLKDIELIAVTNGPGLVGALLAKRWAFPVHLVDCIRDHHNPLAEPSVMMDCLRVADQVVRLREIGDSGNPWRATEACAAAERFGDDIEALAAKIGSLDKIVEDAMMFAQVGKEE